MLTDEISILLLYGLYTALILLLKTTGMMAQFDMGYLLSARDEERSLQGMLGRMNRALNNSVTALALITPPVLAIGLSGKSSPDSVLAAQVFLAVRVIYVPAYMFGITGLRTLLWLAGFAATVILYFLAL